MNKPELIVVSDIHLSSKAPSIALDEGSWYETMERSLNALSALKSNLDAPVAIAGDVFHKPDEPASFVNFVLEHLPNDCYVIPGNHDLPYHNYEMLDKSAFGTLVKSGKVNLVEPDNPVQVSDRVCLFGFPWGAPVKPHKRKIPPGVDLNVALVHAFVWMGEHGHIKAANSTHVDAYKKSLKGYDVAFFGDNHKSFIHHNPKGCDIVNCGMMIQRTTEELGRVPKAFVLYDNGSVESFDLTTTQSRSIIKKDKSEFVTQVKNLKIKRVSFKDIVHQYVKDNELKQEVKEILLESIK